MVMSHHLDTPLASQNGQLYLDDLYVFQGNASTVFAMDVNSNITGVHVKPGFHTEARYEFKVHFDGADFETFDLPSVLRRTGLQRTTAPASACSHWCRGARRLRNRPTRAGGTNGRAGQ